MALTKVRNQVIQGAPVNVLDYGADSTGSADSTTAVSSAVATGSPIYFPAGTYKITSEISLNSNQVIYGDGQGISTLLFYKASNPASSEFMLAARNKNDIIIRDLTIKSNAYDDGLFDVGTYIPGPPKKYTGGTAGNINGILISTCSDVIIKDCEVTGFNYHGIRVSVQGNASTDYNLRLTFENIYGHNCLAAPLSILGTKRFKITGCTFTDNGNFTDDYIDCSIGYGVVIGRTPSAGQLRSSDGICANNYCARNARHGIDAHAGVNLLIENNICEDNLLMGIGVLDYGGTVDDFTGDVVVQNNLVQHTSWVVSKYPLVTYRDDGSERDDSLGIYISGFSNLIINAIIQGNTIREMRYRQITTNTSTDLTGSIFCSGVGSAVVRGNSVENLQTSYYPSLMLNVSSPRVQITDNYLRGFQRSTVSKAYFIINASGGQGVANVSGNYFQCIGAYSDTAGTQAAYPVFYKVAGDINFSANAVVESSQGTRGPLWQTGTTNYRWGFNGILSENSGNTLKVGGTTTIEYGNQITGSLDIYLSAAGSGRKDGFSASSSFAVASASELLNIISDLPKCLSGLTLHIADSLDLGATAQVTIPAWQDNITFSGDSADNTNSMTKTAQIVTTGNGPIIDCNGSDKNINFEYLYLKCDGVSVITDAKDFLACAIEALDNAQNGLVFNGGNHRIQNTRFKSTGAGTGSGVLVYKAGALVSVVNDSDASDFAYGLEANSSAIYKNSTQPTGATANERTQNGGTIA